MKLVSSFLIAFLFSYKALSQNIIAAQVQLTDALKKRDEVSFSEPRLTWDDFKGQPVKGTKWTAMTHSGIKLTMEYRRSKREEHILIQLYPYMDKASSWYTEKGYNDYTLAHEQLHFDITILVARQLAEALSNKMFNPKKYVSQIDKLHNEYLAKLKKMQDDYDGETNHGINKSQQYRWRKLINAEMQKLALEE